ncbi:MAG: glycosyltransferase [Anaerolineae bacterium]|nr:glycosyltransferase [Anaerolineae bacterium]
MVANNQKNPIISVITINYDRLEDLRKTFHSVISQSYSYIEYIIIDGGSQDGSLSFLQENDNQISFWVSEPDDGIFDAMNKGAAAATGDWIIFMNAGDIFYSHNTLSEVAPHLGDYTDVVYGATELVTINQSNQEVRLYPPQELSNIWREIPATHQSVLIRREVQTDFLFDTSFTWCADHDLLIRLYAQGYRFKKVQTIISRFDTSGGKQRDSAIYNRERWRLSRHGSNPVKRHSYYMYEYFKFLFLKHVVVKVRNALPNEWVLALRRYRGVC